MGRPKKEQQSWQKYPFESMEIGDFFLIKGKFACDTKQDKYRAQKATGFKFTAYSVENPEMGTLIKRIA